MVGAGSVQQAGQLLAHADEAAGLACPAEGEGRIQLEKPVPGFRDRTESHWGNQTSQMLSIVRSFPDGPLLDLGSDTNG